MNCLPPFKVNSPVWVDLLDKYVCGDMSPNDVWNWKMTFLSLYVIWSDYAIFNNMLKPCNEAAVCMFDKDQSPLLFKHCGSSKEAGRTVAENVSSQLRWLKCPHRKDDLQASFGCDRIRSLPNTGDGCCWSKCVCFLIMSISFDTLWLTGCVFVWRG